MVPSKKTRTVSFPHVIITILYAYTSACMKSDQMLKGVLVHVKAPKQPKKLKKRVIYNSSLTLEAEAEASDAADETESVTSEAADLTDLVASEAAEAAESEATEAPDLTVSVPSDAAEAAESVAEEALALADSAASAADLAATSEAAMACSASFSVVPSTASPILASALCDPFSWMNWTRSSTVREPE